MASSNSLLSPELALQPLTKIPRKTKEPARYHCPICYKAFTRSATRRDHLRTHTDERPFVCSSCPKAFSRLKDKNRHELLHNTEKKFACEGSIAVRGEDVPWGCGKRFAREDGLVAHLRSTGNSCVSNLAYQLRQDIFVNLRKCSEFDNPHEIWTCQYRNIWNNSEEGTSTGCGRKFKKSWPLLDHIFYMKGLKCQRELYGQMRIDAAQRAVRLAVRGQKQDQKSDESSLRTPSRRNVKVLCSKVAFGTHGNSMQMRLEVPAENKAWRPFDLDIGGTKITDFKVRGPSEAKNSDGSCVQIYWLDFVIPDAPNTIPEGAPINIRANLQGDWTSYSYDTMILGAFMRRALKTRIMAARNLPGSFADYGRGVAPRMQFPSALVSSTSDTAIYDLMEGLYGYENALSSWSNSEEFGHYLDEVHVMRQEHRMVTDE